jgi:hypothetical protein|tara:strand:- start:13833 stop:15851 length:2019 start_codon:yes stop_codon:yes gene_type:complete
MSAKKPTPAKKAKSVAKKTTPKKTEAKKASKAGGEEAKPLMVSSAAAAPTYTRSRRNAATSIERTDKYKNIEDGLVPFKHSGGGVSSNSNLIDVRDAVMLCQKAYYNFAIFRNTIDLMTEFSSSNIYLRGGSKKSRKFFEALFKKINLAGFMDKFFREYYRSGNVFIYRFDSKIKPEDLKRITQTFGSRVLKDGKNVIPTKYIILNPADIKLTGTLSFSTGRYSKTVTDYELEKLKNPETEEEHDIVKNLPEQTRKQLNSRSSMVLIPLDVEKILAVFYKKQDYEPFAVPMGYPVLEDINAKAEMKKIDMAIARTMQQAILLITMGTEPDKGGVNQNNLAAMQQLFTNESVGRVLIADYTTKAEFVVPKIGDLLDAKKYEIFDRDIRIGLNNVLVGEDEKFSNMSIKVKVFIERLKQARETFINEFLFPEIKRMCKNLGFKNYPTPFFEDIDLKDGLSYARIYNRLVELGVLTPREGLMALETGRLPTHGESIEAQEEFKALRDLGLYQPIVGGAKTEVEEDEEEPDEEDKKKTAPPAPGRPAGTDGIPQEVNRRPNDNEHSAPSMAGELFSLEKIKNNLLLANTLNVEVEKSLRKKHSIKRLTNKQKEVAQDITALVIANENPEDWNGSVSLYLENPVDNNKDRVSQIHEIAICHQVDSYLASILFASKKD